MIQKELSGADTSDNTSRGTVAEISRIYKMCEQMGNLYALIYCIRVIVQTFYIFKKAIQLKHKNFYNLQIVKFHNSQLLWELSYCYLFLLGGYSIY